MYDFSKGLYETLVENDEDNLLLDVEYFYTEVNGIVAVNIQNTIAWQNGGGNVYGSNYYYDRNKDKKLTCDEYLYLLGLDKAKLLKNEAIQGFWSEVEYTFDVLADYNSCTVCINCQGEMGNAFIYEKIDNVSINPKSQTSALVVDAVNYQADVARTETVTDPLKASLKHNVKIPKLAKDSQNARAFNQKILSSCTWYAKLRENIVTDFVVTYNYEYKQSGGVVAILLDSAVERYSVSHEKNMFYYDTVRDKELTFDEYLSRLGVSRKDLAKTYNDNKDNTNLGSKATLSISADKIAGAMLDSGSLTLLLKDSTVVEIYSAVKGLGNASSGIYTGASGEIVMTIGNKIAYVDGAADEITASPIIIDGRTMLPARFVAESMGADVAWDSVKKEVTITKEGIKMVLGMGQKTVYVNSRPITLDAPVTNKNGSTYTPLRFIVETLGGTVDWLQSTKQVVIYKNVSVADVLTKAYKSNADKYKYSFLADVDSDSVPEICYRISDAVWAVDKYKNGSVVTLDKKITRKTGSDTTGEICFVLQDDGDILISIYCNVWNSADNCLSFASYTDYYYCDGRSSYYVEFDNSTADRLIDSSEMDDMYDTARSHFNKRKKQSINVGDIEFDYVWKVQKRRYANANG